MNDGKTLCVALTALFIREEYEEKYIYWYFFAAVLLSCV